MTELKTLKDIEIPMFAGEEDGQGFRDSVKAEAVKWVKEMQKNWHELGNYGDDNFAPESLAFMQFFNITEKDLAK